jgi:UDP-N-acetylmuramate: L-alanyl-gamma-D-glutamyl-meso-diaminopimelate ligase
MSLLLEEAGIRPLVGYDPVHLDPTPDLVVVGNACRRDNPEVVEAERRGVPLLSMPEALARFFLAGRLPLVVAGTHGKTTTTAMAAWTWTACGAEPGYLVGGVPLDLGRSFRAGAGRRFIIEGDEYNAAYFDRGPKFLHYRPQTLILTSVEYDHADLYPDPATLLAAYATLIERLPADGLLVACAEEEGVRRLAERAPCRVVLYGLGAGADVRPLVAPVLRPEETVVRVAAPAPGGVAGAGDDALELRLGVPGLHNLLNALAVWTAACCEGLPPLAVASALAGFRGVKRRLEELGRAGGVTVVDDFAHHPTAVGKTLAALRQRYPGSRVVVAFEPRSLSAGRRFFHDAYLEAFRGADALVLAPIFYAGRLAAEDRLDLPELARRLAAAGVAATAAETREAVLPALLGILEPGDVVVIMSSGDFGGLPQRLLSALGAGGDAGRQESDSAAAAEGREPGL